MIGPTAKAKLLHFQSELKIIQKKKKKSNEISTDDKNILLENNYVIEVHNLIPGIPQIQ